MPNSKKTKTQEKTTKKQTLKKRLFFHL